MRKQTGLTSLRALSIRHRLGEDMLKRLLPVLVFLLGDLSAATALTVGEVVLSRKFRGEPIATREFQPGERIHFRVQVTDYALKNGKADLDQDVLIRVPDGKSMVQQANAGGLVFDKPDSQEPPAFLNGMFQFPSDPLGTWTLQITVHDFTAATTKTVGTTFELRAKDAAVK